MSVPKYSANLGLSYEPQITETMNGLLNVSDSWVGDGRGIRPAYPQILAAYCLMDARAGVSSGPWGAYLYGTNLTNKDAALTINNTVFAWQQPMPSRGSRPISRAPSAWTSKRGSEAAAEIAPLDSAYSGGTGPPIFVR